MFSVGGLRAYIGRLGDFASYKLKYIYDQKGSTEK